MRVPRSIFGAALLGMSFDDAETVAHVLDQLRMVGVEQIDTAPRYPPFNPGKSEELLGETHAASRGFAVDSKVLANPGSGGELEAASIKESISKTLARLGTQQVSDYIIALIHLSKGMFAT
jgi:aflatoxin B1 aldehyde reductase